MRRLMLLLISALLFSSPVLAQDAVLINLADTHSAYHTYGRIINAVQEVTEEYSHVPTYILVNGDLMETGVIVGVRNAGYLDWLFLEELNRLAPVKIGRASCREGRAVSGRARAVRA